ncbi:restriction endonuclease subunit S [Serratia sp. AXJ-M]|uniref:restriction endonuclease subunit S n=1 Tax=Serratia sp. AXJ-M TaxID=2754727 RepID=UPI003978C14B|nr:restriction endonuclease subunit S [Serratia marcescens]
MVPEGWQLSTIEKIATVSSGGTPSRKNASYWNGNIPWVTTAEVQFKTIFDTAEKITVDGLNNSSAKLFPKNTILMAMYGQGKTRGQVAKLGIEATTNQACAAILLKEGYEIDYYYQFLISQYEHIREMSNSGSQENLSAGIVKSIQVPVPPLFEQKKIAQILSTWDKAIATSEKLLANRQRQKKALMKKILTGRDRFSEFTEKWKHHELSDIAMVQMGSSPKSGAYNENGYGLPLIQGNADIKNRRSAPRIFTTEITKECDVGDILLSVRAPVGTVALSSHKACIGRGISAMRARLGFSQNFLYQWFLWFEPRWGALSQGSTFESINSDDIKQLKIKLPSLEEQKKIASILSNADQEIELLQQKLHYLKQEKKALMQQLLTGKRRVKVGAA